MGLLGAIIFGGIVGYIASKLYKTQMGLLGYIVTGILGGAVGGFIFDLLDLSSNGTLGTIVTGVVGAVVLLFVGKKMNIIK